MEKKKEPLSEPKKKEVDVADVIWGGIKGRYETQAISDTTYRQPQTNMAIPSEFCVKENKDWVDFNEK